MLNNKFQNVQCNSADFEHARFCCANVASSEMKIFVQNIFLEKYSSTGALRYPSVIEREKHISTQLKTL